MALWKREGDDFTRSEYVSISNAIQFYYQKISQEKSIFPCFDSFYEFVESDFQEILKRDNVRTIDFDLANFLYVLKPYYRGGEFSYLLNARENLNLLEQPFIVFELDEIQNHPTILPVVTIILMDAFMSKMRKLKGIRKQLLLEEVWKALMKKGMENAILYWVKTIRKYFGELLLVSQDVEDVIKSVIVKNAIINNSDCKILLDQSKYQNKFSEIQELLGLTDKEKALILSMNKANDPTKKYKEVFISLGGVLSKVYRTEVSLEEYLAYTTEEREKMKVQEYSKKYGSIQKGISVLASEIRSVG